MTEEAKTEQTTLKKKIEICDGSLLWTVLPKFFLKTIDFKIDDKTYRKGVFQNYKTVFEQYRIKFKGDTRVMTLPTPFEIMVIGNTMFLDYRVNTLLRGDSRLINTLKRVKKKDVSVFFDKLVKVVAT